MFVLPPYRLPEMQVLETELPKTGDQQPVLKAEADRVVEFAKRYVAEAGRFYRETVICLCDR